MGVLHRVVALRRRSVPGLPRTQRQHPTAAPVQGLPLTAAGIATGLPAHILAVGEAGALGERLLELGLTPGTPVVVTHRTWGGDAVLQVRGTALSLRRAQAQLIRLALQPSAGAPEPVVGR